MYVYNVYVYTYVVTIIKLDDDCFCYWIEAYAIASYLQSNIIEISFEILYLSSVNISVQSCILVI